MGEDHIGWAGQGPGSWFQAQGWKGGGIVVMSPKVSVRCIGPVFTEDKRGARGVPRGA